MENISKIAEHQKQLTESQGGRQTSQSRFGLLSRLALLSVQIFMDIHTVLLCAFIPDFYQFTILFFIG